MLMPFRGTCWHCGHDHDTPRILPTKAVFPDEVAKLLEEAADGLAAATRYGAGDWSDLVKKLRDIAAPNTQHEGCEPASIPLNAPVGRKED